MPNYCAESKELELRQAHEAATAIRATLETHREIKFHQRISLPDVEMVLRRICHNQTPRASGLSAHVVIPYLPNHSYLECCLRSIWAQTVQPDRVTIVVNGPVTSLPSPKDHPNCQFVMCWHESGPFAAIDSVIRNSDCEIIIRIDSDDLSFSRRFEFLMNRFCDEMVDIVGSDCVYFDTSAYAVGIFPVDASAAIKRRYGHVMLYPATAFRKRAYLEGGGFSRFETIGMDTEFVNRLCMRARGINVPIPLYFKRSHDQSLVMDAATGFGSQRRKRIEEYSRQMWAQELSRIKKRR